MKSIARTVVLAGGLITALASFSEGALAVPSYSRRYGVECSSCHTVWGALNATGTTFKLSGYRAGLGVDMKPDTEDIELSRGALVLPSTLPLSFITGVGIDTRTEKRRFQDGSTLSQSGSTIALEDASIFLTSPLGKHLAAFIEFPMYEARAWEFTPTGLSSVTKSNFTNAPKHLQFNTEQPGFEVAKFFWNNILPEGAAPRDSVNALFGITHLPLAYSPGKVRLPVNQDLIYERRALDLLSKTPPDDLLGSSSEHLFRLSEPQGILEIFGMLVPGHDVTDVKKRETLWMEYHIGVTNGSNAKADNNQAKDLYGRFVVRVYNQSFGLFAFRSSDTYDDTLRTNASIVANPGGIMSGNQVANSRTTFGPDFTLSAVPFGIPVWLDNQILFSRESSPTGFNRSFSWKGGFHQLNWQGAKTTMSYVRYDWVHGDHFDDQTAGGVTNVSPSEYDVVVGVQHLIEQNIKLIGEFRHHRFEDKVSGGTLTDSGGTIRLMIGF
jgi:hypothetical protein